MEQETPVKPMSSRWPAWVALGTTLLIGLAMLLPWTRIRDQSVTGLGLIRLDKDLIERLDVAKERRAGQQERREQIESLRPDGPLARRSAPKLRDRPLPKKVEQARNDVAGYVELTEAILGYIRIGAMVLLGIALLPVVWVVLPFRKVSGGCAMACGLIGFTLLGTLLPATWYLSGLELFGKSLPLLPGWWLLVAAALVLGIAGGAWAICTRWKLWLPLQLLPAIAWCAWFGNALGLW